MRVTAATVLICTYNRTRLLRETLTALQAMTPPSDCDVEILVVDNNSTEDTQAVVAECSRDARFPVLYLREPRQGKSFALNTGLSSARGEVVALTDDDVMPESDWLARIVTAFRERDVTFVCGKVLPRWEHPPPPELWTPAGQDIWGPLALVDYGNTPIVYVPESTIQRLPIGANLAFAKAALRMIGGWRTDLGKVNNTLISGEDHEIFTRLRRHGLYSGHYDPENVVRHYVPAERLTRRYFRRWFFWHGKTQALMIDDLFPGADMSKIPRIAGVPRFLYRQCAEQAVRWLKTVGRNNALSVLTEEVRLLRYIGLVSGCWRRHFRRAGSQLTAHRRATAPELLGR